MISGRDIQIEVDGGVNLDNVKQVKEAGLTLLLLAVHYLTNSLMKVIRH